MPQRPPARIKLVTREENDRHRQQLQAQKDERAQALEYDSLIDTMMRASEKSGAMVEAAKAVHVEIQDAGESLRELRLAFGDVTEMVKLTTELHQRVVGTPPPAPAPPAMTDAELQELLDTVP